MRRQVGGLPEDDVDKDVLVVGVEEVQGRLVFREDVKADLRAVGGREGGRAACARCT